METQSEKTIHPKRKAVDDIADSRDLKLWCIDDHDSAILGIVDTPDGNTAIAYSVKGILANLQAMGMDYSGASEFFEFNIERAHVGPGSPLFVEDDFEE